MSTSPRRALAVVSLLVVAACAGEGGGAGGSQASKSAATGAERGSSGESQGGDDGSGDYEVVDVSRGGSLFGFVRLRGGVPPAETVSAVEDAEACGGERRLQRVRVRADRGLADVVITLRGVDRGRPFSDSGSPPVLDQTGCAFEPHVVLAAPSEVVRVLNSDRVTHNVHTLVFENRPRNVSQPPELKEVRLRFSAPERVKVECDIHPWMGAWIVVMEHPYYAVSAEDGAFRLDGIPPGSYTVEGWHEILGTVRRDVVVPPGGSVELALEMGVP